jgi:hypothetical protein
MNTDQSFKSTFPGSSEGIPSLLRLRVGHHPVDDAMGNAEALLSKLVWASDSGSEMQLRDVRTLIDESVDWPYLKDWAAKLGVAAKLDEVSK